MDIKISLIGAGSGAFSLSLIRDICLTKNLEGCTVSFMDINRNAWKAVITSAAGTPKNWAFTSTLRRRLTAPKACRVRIL